jgi:fibronectin type 3 domain-containing protein
MKYRKALNIVASVFLIVPLLGSAVPAVIAAPPSVSSDSASTTNANATTPASSVLERNKNKIRTVNMMQCKRIRNTPTGNFTCVSPKKVKVKAKIGNPNLPTEVRMGKKWVKVPYLWNKNRKALTLSKGMVPWVNALNSKNGVSSQYNLRIVECADPECTTTTKKVVRMQVTQEGWGMNPDGTTTNYKWDTTGNTFSPAQVQEVPGEEPTPTPTPSIEPTPTPTPVSEPTPAPAPEPTPIVVPAPSAPTGLVLELQNSGNVRLSWTANPSNQQIQTYLVSVSPSGGNIQVNGTTATISNLTIGNTYEFNVRAQNTTGTSEPSSTVSTTILIPPSQPTSLTATPSNTTIDLSWNPPTSDGGEPITDYMIFYSQDNGETWVLVDDGVSLSTTYTLTGLTNGTNYYATVAAVNNIGVSETAQPVSAVPYTVPDAPTNLMSTPLDSSVQLNWNVPLFDGGSPIEYYSVSYSTDGTNWTDYSPLATRIGDSLPATQGSVSGLTNGTQYFFRIVSGNAAGDSSPSEQTSTTPATVPSAPTNVSAEPGNAEVTVSWDASSDDGGAQITGYTVTSNPGNFTCTAAGTETSCLVEGLTNGTSYTFSVIATNTAGDSIASSSNATTPRTVPDAPTNVSAEPNNAEATISWDAPVDNGGAVIQGYKVQVAPEGSETITIVGATATITGLTNGTQYFFTVLAYNEAGDGEISSLVSTTPRTVPNTPTNVNAESGNSEVVVSWDAPVDNGGATITEYTATSTPGNFTCSTSGTSCVIKGLTNGTSYTFTVVATNVAGNSLASPASSAATPLAVPSAPTNVSAEPGNTQATVSWDASSDDGGSQITSYTATSNPGNFTCLTSGTSCVVEGLTNGTSYTFTVVTTNVLGNSLTSAASSPVAPRTVPDAPTNVSAEPGNTQATVNWNAPLNDGGATVTEYTVTSTPGGFTCTATGAESSCVVAGLTNGVSYTFSVVATNIAGDGLESESSNVTTPRTVPDAPTNVSAGPDNASATVSWTAPAFDGGATITTYMAASTPGNFTCSTSGTSCVAEGLTNGTSYTFTVVATNAAGDSLASEPSNATTPRTVPDAPTNVSAEPNNAEATISWDAPLNDGGAAIQGHKVQIVPEGSGIITIDGTTATITGLTNGTQYFFTVLAYNEAGDGEISSLVSTTPRTVPDAPTNVSTEPDNASATISWTAPAFDGGATITEYNVTSIPGGFTCVVAGTETSCVVEGLTNGTSYTFTVAATNVAGDSLASEPSNATTPRTVPDAPTNVSAEPDNASATVSWNAPAFNGGATITEYTATSNPGNFTCTVAGTETSCVVEGLTNGVSYTFTVVATNVAGNSLTSEPSTSTTPRTVPDAPTNISAEPDNTSATVSWTAPAFNGGATITEYTVTSAPGGATCTATGAETSCVVEGLTNGVSYTFTVVATNVAGNSLTSEPSTSTTPRTIPDAPTNVSAEPDNTSATVSWTAPAFNGGATITEYTVTSAPGGATCTAAGAETSCMVEGLTNGETYFFVVIATNVAGNSPSSLLVSTTPRTVPDAPTNVSAEPDNASVTVSWNVPVFNGGATITEYTVTSNPGNFTCSTSETTCVVTGLTNGTSYTFSVVATNVAGDSLSSEPSTSTTPRTIPDAPTNVSAEPDNTSATVSWTAPAFNGGAAIAEYTVTSAPGGATCTAAGAETSCMVEGLTNGETYFFVVIATNVAGNSPSSLLVSTTPRTVPDAPTIASITRGFSQLTIDFVEPNNNGGSIVTNYQFSINGGSTWNVRSPVSTASPIIISGLINGTNYDIKIRAVNAAGAGGESNQVSESPGSAPLQPSAPSVANTNAAQRLDVSWSPPNNGGFSITGYTLERRVDSGEWLAIYTGTSTSYNDIGLSTSPTYQYRVLATNILGDSPYSNASTGIRAADVPSTPNAPSVSNSTLARLDVSWTAPANNNLTITGYTLQRRLGTGAWSNVYTGPNLSFIDTGVALGSSYQYRVLATNALGSSAYSSESIARTVQGVVVPNIVDQTAPNANTTLQNSGLAVGTVTNTRITTISSTHNIVVSQSPAAGTVVASGSSVSYGRRHLAVPNVVMLSANDAESYIYFAGLFPMGSPTFCYQPWQQPNIVQSQTPFSNLPFTTPVSDWPNSNYNLITPGSSVSYTYYSSRPC